MKIFRSIKTIIDNMLLSRKFILVLIYLLFSSNLAKADVISDIAKKYKLNPKSNSEDLCKLMSELQKNAETLYAPSIIDSNLVPFYDKSNMPSSAFDTISVQDDSGQEIANFFIVFDTKFTNPLGILDIHRKNFQHGYIFSTKDLKNKYKYSSVLPKKYSFLLEFDKCQIKQLIINQ